MKPIQRTRNFIIAAFLLSLLFHASSVLYVVIQRTYQSSPNELPEQDNSQNPTVNKKDEWVETKARASNFGAPVMFQDIPEEETSQKISQNTSEPEDTVEPEPIEETKQKMIEEIIPEQTTFKENNISENKPANKQQNKPPRKRSTRKKKTTTARGPKPPLSLAQLAQGFLNHMKDEGKHAIHMLGKKSGTPNDEQIKYERYLEKLSWCLHNSFNIHNNSVPPSATESIVYILLALNQDGTMRHCNVAKTSGNTQLDQFTLFIFNDASSSFPPVPHYLPHDPFTITYIITHNMREQNGINLYRR